MQGMQVLGHSCPCVGVHKLLVRLEMVDEVQKDAFEAVPFKVFPHYEHCGVGIDCRTHNCVVTLVAKSSNGGVRGVRFDDIVILDSHRLGSLTRRLTAIGRAFGHRELVRGFLLPGVLLVRGCHR